MSVQYMGVDQFSLTKFGVVPSTTLKNFRVYNSLYINASFQEKEVFAFLSITATIRKILCILWK